MPSNVSLQSMIDMLKSITKDSTIDATIAIPAINRALDALASAAPLRKSHEIIGDGTATTFPVPEDFYDIEAAYTPEGMAMQIVDIRDVQNISVNTPDQKTMAVFGGEYVFFFTPRNGQPYKIFYAAMYPEVDANADPAATTLGFDRRWTMAVACYASAYLLLPESLDTANIRQFGTRMDSGNPMHNPLAERVDYLLRLYDAEIRRHSSYTRGSR